MIRIAYHPVDTRARLVGPVGMYADWFKSGRAAWSRGAGLDTSANLVSYAFSGVSWVGAVPGKNGYALHKERSRQLRLTSSQMWVPSVSILHHICHTLRVCHAIYLTLIFCCTDDDFKFCDDRGGFKHGERGKDLEGVPVGHLSFTSVH